jgi:broad specificity phosphatase PhoE
VPLVQDDSQWPVVVDAMIGPPSDEDIRSYNARRAERLSRAERHVQVMDGRSGMRLSSRHRRMIAEFDAQNRGAQRRYLAGVALVTQSVALRALLRAIYRVTPSVCPRRPWGSLDQATSWARGLLQDPR